jgi:hypothetical protein
MNSKKAFSVFGIALSVLLLVSLACSAEWQMQSDAATQAAGTMRATLTAIFAQTETQQYLEELTATPTPPTPTPTCVMDVSGVCVGNLIEGPDILGTQRAMINPSESGAGEEEEWNTLFKGRVNHAVPIFKEPGVGETEEGRMFPYKNFPVQKSVSGWIKKKGVEGHYYGTRLTCWLEFIDMNADMTRTAGIKHAWEHSPDTHAHCQTKNGVLIAQIWPNHPILEVYEVDEERSVAKVLLKEVWLVSEDVERIE